MAFYANQCARHGASHSNHIYCVSADPSAAQIEMYNDSSKRFEKFSEIPLKNRQGYGVVLHKNKIFIIGGWANNVFLKSVLSYDLEIKLYEEGKEEGLSEMKVARANATTIPLGKYIYVLGGCNQDGILNSCERFDTENNSWESIKSMNVGRQHLTAAALNENIYISGGKIKIDPLSKSNSVELYDPETDEWKNVAPMNKYRGRSELVAFNGFLYAMGDFSSGIDRFDPLENSWKEIGHYSGASFANLIESNGRLFAITQIGTFYKINIFDREFRRNVSLSGSNQCKITVNSLGESNYKAGGGCYFLFHV